MQLNDIIKDIKETVVHSTLFVNPIKLDNYMVALGAVSYFEFNSTSDFLNDEIPAWYFVEQEAWIGLNKRQVNKYSFEIGDVVIL